MEILFIKKLLKTTRTLISMEEAPVTLEGMPVDSSSTCLSKQQMNHWGALTRIDVSTQLEGYKERSLEILGSFGLLCYFCNLALKHCSRGIVGLKNWLVCIVLANKCNFCTNISPIEYSNSELKEKKYITKTKAHNKTSQNIEITSVSSGCLK